MNLTPRTSLLFPRVAAFLYRLTRRDAVLFRLPYDDLSLVIALRGFYEICGHYFLGEQTGSPSRAQRRVFCSHRRIRHHFRSGQYLYRRMHGFRMWNRILR